MNRFIQSTEGTVLFRMSPNAEYYTEDIGRFEVRCRRRKTRIFDTLLEAFLYYYTVEEEAELWDNTDLPILVESKVMFFLN